MSNLKKQIEQVLANKKLTDLISNIQVFDNNVEIDVFTNNPAMHERKKMESALDSLFKEEIEQNINVKYNFVNKEKETEAAIDKRIKGVKNIIAVASGKGGVGKSTVSSNIAVTLKKMGFSVGILDTDIYGPSMPTLFDVEDSKPHSVQVDGKAMIKPVESEGLKIMSIGFFANTDQAVVWRGPMASKALKQMIRDTHWGDLDFLILDLPPGTGDVHLSLVQEIPINGTIIVSTPQKVALTDVRKGVAMFKIPEINIPILGIVENMAYFTPEELPDNKYYIFGNGGAKNMSELLNVNFLGEVPLVQSIREAGDAGRPAALQKNTLIEQVYTKITQNVVEELVKRNETMPPTEAVRITNMAGCSAIKK